MALVVVRPGPEHDGPGPGPGRLPGVRRPGRRGVRPGLARPGQRPARQRPRRRRAGDDPGRRAPTGPRSDLAIALAGAPMAADDPRPVGARPAAPGPPVGHAPGRRGAGPRRVARRGPDLPGRPGRLADPADPGEPVERGPARGRRRPARRARLDPDPAAGRLALGGRSAERADPGRRRPRRRPGSAMPGSWSRARYRVTAESDRMGLRLEGPPIGRRGPGRSALGAGRARGRSRSRAAGRSSWGWRAGRWAATSTSPT